MSKRRIESDYLEELESGTGFGKVFFYTYHPKDYEI